VFATETNLASVEQIAYLCALFVDCCIKSEGLHHRAQFENR
jgi:hypothetical protein